MNQWGIGFWRLGTIALFLLVLNGMVLARQYAIPPDRSDRMQRTRNCKDVEAAELVGLYRTEALAKLRKLAETGKGYREIRVLDGMAPVNYEVMPQRLTLVIGNNGVVTRSFCR